MLAILMTLFFKAIFEDRYMNILKIKDIGLKKLLYNNKMPTYVELIQVLKEKEIRGYFHYTKSKLIDLLTTKRLISENMVLMNKKRQRRI